MNGWMLQWYLNVPALLRATVVEAFGSMFPVSKLLPLSAVNVCAVLSLLVTVIFVPCFTVSVAGTNLKLAILTAFDAPDFGCDEPPDVDDVPDCEALELELPQPAIGAATAATEASETMA